MKYPKEYLDEIIKKHEFTRPDKENDRVRHIESLNAQTGPVFLTYRSNDVWNRIFEEQSSKEACVDITAPDGVRHTETRPDHRGRDATRQHLVCLHVRLSSAGAPRSARDGERHCPNRLHTQNFTANSGPAARWFFMVCARILAGGGSECETLRESERPSATCCVLGGASPGLGISCQMWPLFLTALSVTAPPSICRSRALAAHT